MAGGQVRIEDMVAAAMRDYEFFRRDEDRELVRRARSGGGCDRLVKGRWVNSWRRAPDEPEWEELSAARLRTHARRYLTAGLGASALGWGHPIERFSRSRLWGRVFPPLKGGAGRRLEPGIANGSRQAYKERMGGVAGDDLTALLDQAERGYQQQRERGAGAEQRANFFLGAAGLTSTLVLANASFLIGEDKLGGIWLKLAVVALVFASVCAVVTGLRALEAAMITFVRTPPNAVTRIVKRGEDFEGDELGRAYLAALLVAQARAGVVGDWKVSRLKEARTWFMGVLVGTVALTACVLFGAVF